MHDPGSLPRVFIPEQAVLTGAPDGRQRIFLYLPQLDRELKKVLGFRPREVTYRWAYHPGERLHVLFAYWPLSEEVDVQVGVAIPEGAGDPLLDALEQGAELYLTLEPLPSGDGDRELTPAEVQRLLAGLTVHLPQMRFRRRRA